MMFGGLLLEVRIIRGHITVESVGLEAVLTPHSGDHHVETPNSVPSLRVLQWVEGAGLALDRPFENASLQLRVSVARLLTGMAA